MDYYLLYGPEPKDVVSDWAWLTGPTPLPPLWALGFQQSRYTYFPESQLREVATRMRKDRIPCDVLWLDIDFQHENWPFTVNEKAFPDFAGMVKDLAREQFKLVVITDLHIAKQANVGYAPYDSGVAGDHFVKNPRLDLRGQSMARPRRISGLYPGTNTAMVGSLYRHSSTMVWPDSGTI